jgi:hypothetical protein
VIVTCRELGVEELYQILKFSEGSILRQYTQAFEAYGIEIEFTDEGLRRIAELAFQEKTGARALVGVCERTFREFKYHLPNSGVRRLHVTPELVDSPLEVLQGILEGVKLDQINSLECRFDEIAQRWSQRHGIEIHLQREASQILCQKTVETGVSPEAVFAEALQNYEHGLNLIRKARGIKSFEITPEVIENPGGTLDRWIREYYIS